MKGGDEAPGENVELSLCDLLNIDVDKLALMIVQGKDPWAEKDLITADSSATKDDAQAP